MTTWNPADNSGATLSNGNLTASCNGATIVGVRSTTSKSTGTYYWEVTASTVSTNLALGIANSSESLTTSAGLGGDADGAGFYCVSPIQTLYANGAQLGNNGSTTSGNGDVLCFACNFSTSPPTLWVYDTAMGEWNNAPTANPSTGSGGQALTGLAAGPYFIIYNDGSPADAGSSVILNCGGSGGFTRAIPTGFAAWDAAASSTGAVHASAAVSAASRKGVKATGTVYAAASVSAVSIPIYLQPALSSFPPAVPVLYQQTDYLTAFLSLLPQGRIWDKETGSPMYQAMASLMPTIARLSDDAANLLTDAYVASTVQLLPEWQQSLGLPDPCAGDTVSITQEQQQCVGRFIGPGGISIPCITNYANNLGYPIAVNEFMPFYADLGTADEPLANESAAYLWEVVTPDTNAWLFLSDINAADEPLGGFGSPVLVCELNNLAPAFTQPYYAVSGAVTVTPPPTPPPPPPTPTPPTPTPTPPTYTESPEGTSVSSPRGGFLVDSLGIVWGLAGSGGSSNLPPFFVTKAGIRDMTTSGTIQLYYHQRKVFYDVYVNGLYLWYYYNNATSAWMATYSPLVTTPPPPPTPTQKTLKAAMLTWLTGLAGHHTIVFQQLLGQSNDDGAAGLQSVFNTTGRWPGGLAGNYYNNDDSQSQSVSGYGINTATPNAKLIAHWNAGGIVSLSGFMWPCPSTAAGGGANPNSDNPQVNGVDLVTPGTATYNNWLATLDAVAAGIQQLAANGIVTLFRPLHEQNGNWFWWGTGITDAQFVALWQLTYNYLSQTKALANNIIWIYAVNGTDTLPNRYPGASYVDIVGFDYYDNQPSNGAAACYNSLSGYGKPVAWCEWGPNNSPVDETVIVNAIKNQVPNTIYWEQWSTQWAISEQTNLTTALTDAYVLTRGNLNRPTVGIATPPTPTPSPSPTPTTIRLMCMGDSVTAGGGASPPPGSYRAPLYTTMTNAGYRVQNVGDQTYNPGSLPASQANHEGIGGYSIQTVNGDTTNPGILDYIRANNTLATYTPNVIMLIIGYNNMYVSPPENVGPSGAYGMLQALIAYIFDQLPTVKLIVGTLPANTGDLGVPTANASSISELGYYNYLILNQLSTDVGNPNLSIVDVNGAENNYTGGVASLIGPDGIHPNSLGCSVIAQTMYNGLTALFPSAAAKPRVVAPLTGTVTTGTWQTEDINVANVTLPSGKAVHFNYLLPAQYNPNVAYPVMLWMHPDFEADPWYLATNTDPTFLPFDDANTMYNTVSFRTNYPAICVVVYADQTSGGADGNDAVENFGGWTNNGTVGSGTNASGDTGPNTFATLGVTQWVLDNLSADKSRVYLAGFSLGGIGAAYLMLKYNQINGSQRMFTAATSAGGVMEINGFGVGPSSSDVTTMTDVPVWWVSGQNDGTSIPGDWNLPMWRSLAGNSNYPAANSSAAASRAGTSQYYFWYAAGVGHSATDLNGNYYATYPQVLAWLFAQIGPV